MIHRLVNIDRATLSRRQIKVSDSYAEVLKALAISAINWTNHGRHVVFIDEGIKILDSAGKVVFIVKMEHEEA